MSIHFEYTMVCLQVTSLLRRRISFCLSENQKVMVSSASNSIFQELTKMAWFSEVLSSLKVQCVRARGG